MTDRDILEAVQRAKEKFGLKCAKYSGALTVELIRRALKEEGVLPSPRDMFIVGVPLEIDIVIPKRDAKLQYGLAFEPTEVLATIVVKNAGSFGDRTVRKIRKDRGGPLFLDS